MKTDKKQIAVKAITKHALQLCVLLTAGLLLSACKPEAQVAKDVDPTGVYALVSVNGSTVPASVSHDGTALQVRACSPGRSSPFQPRFVKRGMKR